MQVVKIYLGTFVINIHFSEKINFYPVNKNVLLLFCSKKKKSRVSTNIYYD